VDPRGLAFDDEVVERPGQHAPDRVEVGGVLYLARYQSTDLGQPAKRFGLDVLERAPLFDIRELRGEPISFRSGSVALGCKLVAEVAPVLGVDPAVGVVTADASETFFGAALLERGLFMQGADLGELAIAGIEDRLAGSFDVEDQLLKVPIHRPIDHGAADVRHVAVIAAE
jgi:hypothetical protein